MAVDGDSARHASLGERLGLGPWLPFTGRGLAGFAEAGAGRLVAFQILFSALVSLSLVWGVRQMVFPVVQNALAQLPETLASIQASRLRWPDAHPVVLASSPQLALCVNPGSSPDLGLNGDVQFELRDSELAVRGVLGAYASPYRPNLDLPLDRIAAGAEWGAWRSPMLALLGVGTFLVQLLLFWILPLVHAVPTWTLGWVLRRSIHFPGAYRIAAASLWPASLLPVVAIPLYSLLWIRIPGLVFLFLAQFVLGWMLLLWAILSLPARPARESTASNPFSGSSGARPGTRRKGRNPFHS
ncbi:MAG: hypothetical protein JNL10_17780 [Verrucomicrobiales bacterium]|nr:hypothetical protein [Verrucomicrobiales bacterium]